MVKTPEHAWFKLSFFCEFFLQWLVCESRFKWRMATLPQEHQVMGLMKKNWSHLSRQSWLKSWSSHFIEIRLDSKACTKVFVFLSTLWLKMEVFVQVDLAEYIEWQSVECLNEKLNHTFVNALKQVSTHLHNDYCSSKSRLLHLFHEFLHVLCLIFSRSHYDSKSGT